MFLRLAMFVFMVSLVSCASNSSPNNRQHEDQFFFQDSTSSRR